MLIYLLITMNKRQEKISYVLCHPIFFDIYDNDYLMMRSLHNINFKTPAKSIIINL